MTDLNTTLAQANFAELARNPYPGRGIVAGLDETGKYMVQVYWIMGRSDNSRNRIFAQDEETGRLYTEPADAAKVEDPSLIIYNAMREAGSSYVVSNGDQTDTVIEALGYENFSLEQTLGGREYEPDKPNFTQRITAVSKVNTLYTGSTITWMSILRKSLFDDRCDQHTYRLNPGRGFGFCVTTYSGDDNPLPAFRGDPLLMPLVGDRQTIAEAYWAALNEENRVSLAVKFIGRASGRSDIHIINKYSKVG